MDETEKYFSLSADIDSSLLHWANETDDVHAVGNGVAEQPTQQNLLISPSKIHKQNQQQQEQTPMNMNTMNTNQVVTLQANPNHNSMYTLTGGPALSLPSFMRLPSLGLDSAYVANNNVANTSNETQPQHRSQSQPSESQLGNSALSNSNQHHQHNSTTNTNTPNINAWTVSATPTNTNSTNAIHVPASLHQSFLASMCQHQHLPATGDRGQHQMHETLPQHLPLNQWNVMAPVAAVATTAHAPTHHPQHATNHYLSPLQQQQHQHVYERDTTSLPVNNNTTATNKTNSKVVVSSSPQRASTQQQHSHTTNTSTGNSKNEQSHHLEHHSFLTNQATIATTTSTPAKPTATTLHPLGIQSSANCPPFVGGIGVAVPIPTPIVTAATATIPPTPCGTRAPPPYGNQSICYNPILTQVGSGMPQNESSLADLMSILQQQMTREQSINPVAIIQGDQQQHISSLPRMPMQATPQTIIPISQTKDNTTSNNNAGPPANLKASATQHHSRPQSSAEDNVTVPPTERQLQQTPDTCVAAISISNKGVLSTNNTDSSGSVASVSAVSNNSSNAINSSNAAASHSNRAGTVSSNVNTTTKSSVQVPPFYLFDAPCELRTNFVQSQRMHGLPVTGIEDVNSFHYGMAVNGFHPQVNAQDNPILPLNTSRSGTNNNTAEHHYLLPTNAQLSGATMTASNNSVHHYNTTNHHHINMPPVKLVDGRHVQRGNKDDGGAVNITSGGGGKGGKERNEREQKRAKKITELIETLRLSMQKGGWRIEMKSKYQTLTTCADYVKHLIKITQEKEAAVEQAKLDLTVREFKIVNVKALLESRSDPESVTSSLTTSTTHSSRQTPNSKNNGMSKNAVVSPKERSSESDDRGGNKNSCIKRANEKFHVDEGVDVSNNVQRAAKQIRVVKTGRTDPAVNGSSGEEGIKTGTPSVCSSRRMHNISICKMSCSMSKMIYSNKGSSNGGTGYSDGVRTGIKDVYGEKNLDNCPTNIREAEQTVRSTSSASPTAAVERGGISLDCQHNHATIIVKKNCKAKKRKRLEATSVEKDFKLDYEEVFLTSNVPQLIATPAGKILAWNDFFLRATGLTKEQAKRLTMFSMVQADKLSNLFEMIAQALRINASSVQAESVSGKSLSTGGGTTEEERSRDASCKAGHHPTLTLPCNPFYGSSKRHAVGQSHHPNPLYMTVTLMADKDPQKRCFHGVLTDCPGTYGSIGSITPELMSKIFSEFNYSLRGRMLKDKKEGDHRKTASFESSMQLQ